MYAIFFNHGLKHLALHDKIKLCLTS